MEIKALVQKEDPIIFEIGSNDGTDTVAIAKQFINPEIHCFEPDPNTFNILKSRVSPLGKKIYPNCCALSNTIGKSVFHVADNTYSSSLKEPLEHLSIYSFVGFPYDTIVETNTLDNYAKEHNITHCDFVWMDVQGAEDLVIEGGKEFFNNVRFLYTEFSNKELYRGALNKYDILRMLPGFEIAETVREWDADGDVLLINKKCNG